MNAARVAAAALAAILTLVPRPSAAQVKVDGFALQVHEPTYSGDRFFAAPDATVSGRLTPAVKLTFNYANQPLRVVNVADGKEIPFGGLVRDQLYLNLDASLALFDRVKVDLSLPFVAWQSGDALVGTDQVRGGQVGDLRFGARVALLGTAKDEFALGLQADLFIPIGSKQDFAGDSVARGHPRLVASGLVNDRWVYAAALGVMIRSHDDMGIGEIGTALTYSAAGGMLLWDKRLQVGPEVYGSTTFAGGATPLEAMLGAKVCLPAGLVAGAGVGAGLSRAPGAAAVRVLASLAWEPGRDCKPSDRDEDGIADAEDACPKTRGVASKDPQKNGCPEDKDRDRDGIANADDACPDEKGVPSDDPKRHGCPADRDGDGVPDDRDACPDVAGPNGGCPADADGDGIPDSEDACPTLAGVKSADGKLSGCPEKPADEDGDGVPDSEDVCPKVAGPASADPKLNGCPPPEPDGDGDGVPDKKDACPDKAGEASDDPKKNGCPAIAVLRKDKIVILQQIQFELGKATIKPESEKIVREVATVLTENPNITKLAIEGHTDNLGPKELNLKLSKDRANAVRDWLVRKAKIDKQRLTADGFGMERPIAPNMTEAGRQSNRRVEFRIMEQSE